MKFKFLEDVEENICNPSHNERIKVFNYITAMGYLIKITVSNLRLISLFIDKLTPWYVYYMTYELLLNTFWC
jgi:hypothetical protein